MRSCPTARCYVVGRKRIRRLMAKMGLAPIYQRPRTTVPHPEHRVFPYLLRDLVIGRPNQLWCADITYLPSRVWLPSAPARIHWRLISTACRVSAEAEDTPRTSPGRDA